jgi:osmoprotectant transport system permease protein
MHSFGHVLQWLFSGQHWVGPDGIPLRVLEHMLVSFASVLGAILVAVPVGLLVGHKHRGQLLAVSIANIGRAVPSFAVLVLVFVVMLHYIPSIAFGYGPGFVALMLLAIPPILTNTYVGVQGVDPDLVEAARGMGFRERDVLFRLEVPLAINLIMGGIRTAAVQVVATASLIAAIGGGGLGRYIIDGFARNENDRAGSGAILIAILAILTEVAFASLQRAVTPKAATPRTSRPPRSLSDAGAPAAAA